MTTVYRVLRQLRLSIALVTAAAGLLSHPALAGADEIAGVRSSSAAVRELIDDGMWESPMFRGLVKKVAGSDGIVYIEEGTCYHGVHACLLLALTPAGNYRILQILVDLHAYRKRLDMIAAIGHELWHALEVLAERTIRSAAAIFQFYAREASTAYGAFETPAAVSAGIKIRRELGTQPLIVFEQVALNAAR